MLATCWFPLMALVNRQRSSFVRSSALGYVYPRPLSVPPLSQCHAHAILGCQANIMTLRSSCKVAWGRARWKPYTSQECLASTDFAPVVPRPPQYTSADRRCRIIPRRFSQSDWPALAHPRQAHPYRCRHPTRRHRRIGGIDSLDPLVPALSLGSPAVPPRFQTLLSGEAVWCAGLACL